MFPRDHTVFFFFRIPYKHVVHLETVPKLRKYVITDMWIDIHIVFPVVVDMRFSLLLLLAWLCLHTMAEWLSV